MHEIFKTVLILSIFGFCITTLLLLLKPITAKKLPAGWQYCVWIAVLFSMIIPAYKLIGPKEVQKIPFIPQSEAVQSEIVQNPQNAPGTVVVEDMPAGQRDINTAPDYHIRLFDLLAYVWLAGMCIYLTVLTVSYIYYLIRNRKRTVMITENAVLDEVRSELKIKRNIKIRMSPDIRSPMLVGVLFPVIYLPCREIADENMRMVFLHELTHYKRKDLIIKWFSLFVNAVHWFNPLAYILCANVSEACEISCDMAVTKSMSDAERKSYMKTIIELVE